MKLALALAENAELGRATSATCSMAPIILGEKNEDLVSTMSVPSGD